MKRNRREVSWDFEREPYDGVEDNPVYGNCSRKYAHNGLYTARPMWDGFETALEALISCAPFEDPQTSQQERLPLREVLADAIDALPPRERFVFESRITERVSLRELARSLSISKSQVHRIKDNAIALLREALRDHPAIEEYLHGRA